MSETKSQPIMILDSEEQWLEEEVKRNVWTGPFNKAVGVIDSIYNWGRRSSIWPMQFGLACCAIEMICAGGGRFDIARFGAELFRPSPRQADLMIVAGTVTKKMVPAIVRLYNQMAEPKYVLAMGACATAGGPFKEGYNVVSGIDKFLPVDVYVPGCPPTPQALLNGLITLQNKIDAQSVRAVSWYRSETHEAIPEPRLGPDIFDPRRAIEIKQLSADPAKMEELYVRIANRAEVKHGKKEGEGSAEGGAAKSAATAKPAASATTKPPAKPPATTSATTTPPVEPASSPPGAAAVIEANRGQVKPIPATQIDKIMLDRRDDPPGDTSPEKPARPGLPTASPSNEVKLEELKADADFAARQSDIHGDLAKGSSSAQVEAKKLETQTENAVSDAIEKEQLPAGELKKVEPGAGESKEATKKFEGEINDGKEL